jgi:CrcB protein
VTAAKFLIYLAVFIGGGLESALRHVINTTGVALLGPHFPTWTIFINVTGSVVMGLLAGFSASA